MAIEFKPFEELFAPEYQSTYIVKGYVSVGPHAYNVFHNYTMTERQVIFQVCKKHLPWEATQEQEQWERKMYMYQFIIKSPPPFPYEQYTLSEDIIMAIEWELKISTVNITAKRADVSFIRTDTESTLAPQTYSYKQTVIAGDTPEETAILRQKLLDGVKFNVMKDAERNSNVDALVTNLEQAGKAALETWEAGR